ncbi:MAG: PIN domain-containing protein [Armatimonadota bacterium]
MIMKTILIDTNILLHYRQLDQIDWLKEFDVERIVILIPPVVIGELEDHKVRNQSKLLRHRAADCVKWLNSVINSKGLEAEIRNGVVLRFLDYEPHIDFSLHRLRHRIEDDRLLAHAIEWNNDHPDSPVTILTSDTGVNVKARGRKLQAVFWAGNKYLLPEEEDSDQKRIRNLERENAKLKSRMPVLDIMFADMKKHQEFCLEEIPKQKIEMCCKEIWERNQSGRRYIFDDNFSQYEHDERVRGYLKNYESWLKQVSYYQGHIVAMRFLVANGGNVPAEDVDIKISFPTGIVLSGNNNVGLEPEKPKVSLAWQSSPVPPFVKSETMMQTPKPMAGIEINGPVISEEDASVSYHLNRVKHKQPIYLPPAYIVYDDPADAKDQSVQYHIFADNQPEVVKGTLHLHRKHTEESN